MNVVTSGKNSSAMNDVSHEISGGGGDDKQQLQLQQHHQHQQHLTADQAGTRASLEYKLDPSLSTNNSEQNNMASLQESNKAAAAAAAKLKKSSNSTTPLVNGANNAAKPPKQNNGNHLAQNHTTSSSSSNNNNNNRVQQSSKFKTALSSSSDPSSNSNAIESNQTTPFAATRNNNAKKPFNASTNDLYPRAAMNGRMNGAVYDSERFGGAGGGGGGGGDERKGEKKPAKIYTNIYTNPPGQASPKAYANVEPNVNTPTVLIARRANLGPNGGFSVAQKIKNESYVIQKLNVSENGLLDEGVIYLALTMKQCSSLKHLSLAYNGITDYGLRILLENLNPKTIVHLDLSGNKIGFKGIELISKFLPATKLQSLILNSAGIDMQASKSLTNVLNSNTSLKAIDLSKNQVKLNAAHLLTNNVLEELYLSNNGIGPEGIQAITECVKQNKALKLIDLSSNRLNYDCAVQIANSLQHNKTLKSLNLNNNNITTSGIYEILTSINNEISKLEYLGLKNIPILKHLILTIEFIQQRRRFNCVYGPVVLYPDSVIPRSDDDPMMKLTKILSDKRMRLIDMFKILDKNNTLSIERNDFIRRLKIFEPRFLQKDLVAIADNFSNNSEHINYSSLNQQMPKANGDQQYEINRRKLQITEEEDKIFFKKLPLQNGVRGGMNFKKQNGGGGSTSESVTTTALTTNSNSVSSKSGNSDFNLNTNLNSRPKFAFGKPVKTPTKFPAINNSRGQHSIDDDLVDSHPSLNKHQSLRNKFETSQQQQPKPLPPWNTSTNKSKSKKPTEFEKSIFSSENQYEEPAAANKRANGRRAAPGAEPFTTASNNASKRLLQQSNRGMFDSDSKIFGGKNYDFLDNFEYDEYDTYGSTFAQQYPRNVAKAAANSRLKRTNVSGDRFLADLNENPAPKLNGNGATRAAKPARSKAGGGIDEPMRHLNESDFVAKSQPAARATNKAQNNLNKTVDLSTRSTQVVGNRAGAAAYQPPRKRLSKSLEDADLFELYDDGYLDDAELVEFMNGGKMPKRLNKTKPRPAPAADERPRFTTSLSKKEKENIYSIDSSKFMSRSVNNQLGVNGGGDLYPPGGFSNTQSSSSILDINKSYERRKVNLAQGSSNPLSLY